MEQGNIEVDNHAQHEQTDLESLAETLTSFGNSSITQVPFSCDETEFDFDETIENLLQTQFSSKETKESTNEKDVQEWLNTTEDETQQALDLQPDLNFRHSFDVEDIEKTAALLVDTLKNEPFNSSAWAAAETEQEVPSSGDYKSNFILEAKERPVLTLMNSIKTICNEPTNNSDHVYVQMLQYTTRNAQRFQQNCSNFSQGGRERAIELPDTNMLKNFKGYFAQLRLKFVRCPQRKRPLVRSVEEYVSNEIAEAAKTGNAVIFTRYVAIPEIVKKCNDKKGLNFNPEQIAKYGIVLQKAVNQEIVARCLAFLKHVGFSVLPDDDEEENKMNLSSNESGNLSQGLSSQGSQHDDRDSYNSQNSQRSEIDPEVAENHFAAQNSPEVLRVHIQDDDNSPGSSQRSWQSYDSQSPPQLSLPEREPVGGQEPLINQEDDHLPELEMGGFVMIEPHHWLPENASDESPQSSLESEEPRRRRRRLE